MRRDRITEYLAEGLPDTVRRLDGAAFLNPAEDCEQFRRLDVANGPVADAREYVALKAPQHLRLAAFGPPGRLLCVPLARDALEAAGLRSDRAAFCACRAALGSTPSRSSRLASSRAVRASLRLTAGYTPSESRSLLAAVAVLERHQREPSGFISRYSPPPSKSL